MRNYSPLDYLKIDVSNMRGLDQEQFEDRIAWFDRVESNPDVSFKDYIEYANKPYQYIAAVQAYEDALAGKPTGHMVGLDAAASGITIMGAVMGCKTTCKNTGLIGSKRMDMYGECTKATNDLLGSDNQYPRKLVKSAMMCHYYGSKAEPKNTFGEGETLQAFYDAQETVAPGAVWLREELLMSWQAFDLNHSSIMPDGFTAINPVLEKFQSKIEIDELDHASIQYVYEANVGSETGLSVAANLVHQIDGFIVRELSRRCNYDRNQLLNAKKLLSLPLHNGGGKRPKIESLSVQHEFMSLVAVEHITASNVHEFSVGYKQGLIELINQTLEYQSFEVVSIHDQFNSHPNHVNQMRRVYIELMAELAESEVMACIIGQVRNDPDYKIKKLSDDLGDLIRDGEYAIS